MHHGTSLVVPTEDNSRLGALAFHLPHHLHHLSDGNVVSAGAGCWATRAIIDLYQD